MSVCRYERAIVPRARRVREGATAGCATPQGRRFRRGRRHRIMVKTGRRPLRLLPQGCQEPAPVKPVVK